MITIAITPEAFAIITAMLPEGYKAELRPDGNGGYQVTLPNGARTTEGDARALRELERRDPAAGEGVIGLGWGSRASAPLSTPDMRDYETWRAQI